MIVKKSWNDITVEEWIDLEKMKSTELPLYSRELEKLSILCEMDSQDNEFDDLDIDDIDILLEESKFINIPPSTNYKTDINQYKLINFNKITNGEWIDIDHYISRDLVGNFCKLLAIIYRKYKTNEWGEEITEPYEFDINKRIIEFENLPITYVYGSIETLIKWRNSILESYKSQLTIDDGDELDEEEKIGLTERDIKEIEEDLKLEKIKKDFSWIKFIYDLAGEDITKIKKVLQTSFILTMNNQVMLSLFNNR